MKLTSLVLRVTSFVLAAGGMTMDELAIDFKMIDDSGNVVSPDKSTALAVRVGTDKMLQGSYAFLVFNNTGANESEPSVYTLRPGLVSSSEPIMLSGKEVFELVNANQSSSLASPVLTMPTKDISVLSSAIQLLVNTTDGQAQDLPSLLKGPLTSLNAVAGILPGTASQALLKRSLDQRDKERPTKTRENKGRKSARPTKPVNITLNLGNGTRNGAHGGGEMLQQGAFLTWICAALLVFAAA
ncbi:hypothetical protein ST47_g2752 [Ascochyta rabiei]|uniref:Uncharacterized protein n=1 Tax=Didymella rabiei TaxID=5454 RepID=A0A163J265_DIDRA|nr:hypothetical protein ST47_g2752 [Ascochyta rabiei]